MQQIGDRIYYLRKELNLSQEAFGNKIGIKKSSMSSIEKNKSNPSEQTIKFICKEFNVNYSWLMNGTGDIFLETEDALLDALAEEYGLSEIHVRMIKEFLKLEDHDKDVFVKYLENVFLKNGE